MVGLFTNEPQIIRQAGQLMLIIAATTVIQTSALSYTGCLRGAGDAKYIAVTAFISIAIIRPISAWLLCYPVGLGLVGAWFSLFIDQCALLAQRNAFPHREMGAHRGLSGITSSECDNESVAVC